jgi:hypothetical protein
MMKDEGGKMKEGFGVFSYFCFHLSAFIFHLSSFGENRRRHFKA